MRALRLKLIALVLIALGIAFSACTGGNSQTADDTAHVQPHVPNGTAQLLVVKTTDYQFHAPDTVAAGLTNLRLINYGKEMHHVWLIRLQEGKTMTDLLAWLQTSHSLPTWAVDVGGPNTPDGPGAANEALVRLEPGNHVLLCVIPSADGMPHVMKGMVRPLTVIGSAHDDAVLPKADLVMTLDDYTFVTDQPIGPGRHVIRIENAAAQSHEVVIARLEPGKTAHDLLNWVAKPAGPPPAHIVGGITGLARGEVNQITVDFTPGEYALLCFVPDIKDGKPHFMHGMLKQFTVS